MMKTILYIDHSESWKFLLQEELSEEGYQVVTAGSIDEALAKWGEIKPDLIILELRQKRFIKENFEHLKEQYPDIPWIGFSTFFQCPSEYKKWIDYYMPKLPQTDGIKKLIKDL
jgi:DNA-binding NtrC family response regulator